MTVRPDRSTAQGTQGTPGGGALDRRHAAAHVERGIESYAAGNYPEAQRAFEDALAVHPGHVRAVECLAWVREVAAGRRTLQSGTYSAVGDDTSRPAAPADLGEALGDGGSEEGGDSVTREWSSIVTGAGLPVLDVPELSEEQITKLLDLDGARGITLSSTPDPGSDEVGLSAQGDDDEDVDRTKVRLSEAAGEVVELVADSEDDEESDPIVDERGKHASVGGAAIDADDDEPTPLPSSGVMRPLGMGAADKEPALTPLASNSSSAIRKLDQLADDPPSMPTNPFVSQRLSELVAPFLQSSEPQLDVLDIAAPSTAGAIEAALRRGAVREAFDAAERISEKPDPSPDEQALVLRAYEAAVGELSVIPRFGKATADLDSRAAFMMSRMDGATSADDLLDVSGMPRSEATRLLARLVLSGAVTMKK